MKIGCQQKKTKLWVKKLKKKEEKLLYCHTVV